MKDGMWDYLEEVSKDFKIPIKRDENKSWNQMRELWPKHSMLIQ